MAGAPAEPIETDALVVGAGPAGLFTAFQLGLLDIRCHVVDALPTVGGQCAALYADKPIYDIPGLPATTGRDLSERLQAQAAPFEPTYHLGRQVSLLAHESDGRWLVGTQRGLRWRARTVVLAGGIGAFLPRTLPIEGLGAWEGRQVHHLLPEDLAPFNAQRVLVAGGDELAVDAAVRLVMAGALVTLLHRRDELQADAATLATWDAICRDGVATQATGVPDRLDVQDGRLAGLAITRPDGSPAVLPCDRLVVQLGLAPKLGPLAEWGLALAKKQLVVDPATFATNQPGLFAVGDAVTYPGKIKLIVSAFHEATLAAWAAAAVVFPGKPLPLQYTTTSPRLHALLGVARAPAP